ncbi:hypothetical protein [Bacillus sp. AFS096315]|uniref:hypothetical protein n=1 Tax=Bacillus sp. AFS096315 TaxID=2033517 RepID=UPI000BEBE184|nr:hypothetical protein [Bacillus sp. AFS096315]PEC46375.1 hypothetical protein CON00_23935 [Bacillus sp. AFS096315]
MSHMKKYFKYYAMMMALVVVVYFVKASYDYSFNSKVTANGRDAESISPVPKDDLGEFIHKKHRLLNSFTGWGKIDDLSWSNYEEMQFDFGDELKGHVSNNQDMKKDFKTLIQLNDIALRKNDKNAVLYMHRILHDLDVKYNNYHSTAFGYSSYGHGYKSLIIVHRYIEKNKLVELSAK